MKPLRVVVCGVAGRMGGRVLQAVRAEDGMQVVGATERPDSAQVGLDAGNAAGGLRHRGWPSPQEKNDGKNDLWQSEFA